MAATEDHPSTGRGAHRWIAEVPGPDGRVALALTIETAAYPNRSRQRMALAQAMAGAGEAGQDLVLTQTLTGLRVETMVLGPRHARSTPPLWWAEIRESAGTPPAVNLLAFTGHGVAEGTLLDPTGLSNVAVGSSDQLGAVRWYPATGEVDQVYVQPAQRRHGVGQCLLIAVSGLAERRDWPRLWGDGQRTELGEQFRNASPWSTRTAPLTHLAPPMTPGEA